MKYIFSMKMAVMMLFLFAVVIGASTFIENDYGTQTANALVYKAMWFEVFLAYFIAILIFNIIKYKSYKGKIPVFLFHFSFIVIAIGALVTRYVGYEGIMAIREGAVKYEMISNVKNLQVQVSHKDKNTTLSKELYFSTLGKNNLHETLSVNKKKVDIELVKYLPTVHEKVYPSKEGKKYLEFKISTGNRGEIYYLAKGEKKDFGNFYVGYEVEKSEDKPLFLIREKNSTSYTFNFPFAVKTLNMNDKKSGELNAGEHLFKNRMLYQFGSNALVFKDVHESAVHKIDSHDIKTQAGKPEYMQWKVSVGKESKLITTKVYKGQIGNIHQIDLDGVHIDMRVGAKRIDLPFGIKLLDFQLERYPGSKTPASFASEVVLIDKEQGIEKPYRIYMNHILDHRNYRFFQSSYPPDELGTVLSVNHDPGTLPTYIGYFLLIIGMIWSLFIPTGRFRKLLKNARKLQAGASAFLLVLLLSNAPQSLQAAELIVDDKSLKNMQAFDLEHIAKFSKLVVQDYQGRMKPMDTVAHEVISKITGRSSLFGLEPAQMFLGMVIQPEVYQQIPMISLGSKTYKKTAKLLGLDENSKFAKFSDFFIEKNNNYKIFDLVTQASRKKPLEKSTFDKELLKIDERVNVAYMTYQGSLLRIYPKKADENNRWLTPLDGIKELPKDESNLVRLTISQYFQAVTSGVKTGKWEEADKALANISIYQQKMGAAVIPSPKHIEMELKYNQLGLFSKLVPLYIFLGLILLVFAFINVLTPKFSLRYIMYGAWAVLIIGFSIHILGLGIRWYIAGHAPWSNAYESIVFIAASTVFAGIILARQSPFALAGTALLAGITMAVAHMNFINPEITNLVPVLKSYWLMIHVATIISGDGFFGLGSMLSLLVLILYVLRGKEGNEKIDSSIKELSNLSEMGLIIGLMLLTIGNFLGGIWANESWGRYWGWDSKETWAAVTILIYATVLHLRFLPALKSNFIYNMSAMWAYASVLMTYFGVNYYLSGLHSYAAGDPVPIPVWIYYAVASLFVLTLLAARNRHLK